jgi:hypothetical protein
MLAKYEEAVLGDSKAGRPGPGDAGAMLLLSADEHNLVACAMFDFAVELITDAANASDVSAAGSAVARSGSSAASPSASAQGHVEGAAAADRAYHQNLKYGVETKDMITGPFKDAAAGDDDALQKTRSPPPSRCRLPQCVSSSVWMLALGLDDGPGCSGHAERPQLQLVSVQSVSVSVSVAQRCCHSTLAPAR